ncbi:hypothetical protein CFP56_035096 [Quercus suber]|uniref:Uncharacterized protein n=1 Tax=Quercus suber TaxID=58331 RepID=A0AAW0JAC3_QUESU
MWKKLPFEMD